MLTAQVVASHTNRNAYDAKTFTVGAGIERQTNIIWQKKWTWSLGGELVASDERDVIGLTAIPRRRTFFIAAIPTSLAYDGTDDLLNPTRGYRLSGRFSPEASLQDGVFGYARTQIDGSAYLPVAGRTVLAGRVRVGTITGASRDRIAPSRRFYSGGPARIAAASSASRLPGPAKLIAAAGLTPSARFSSPEEATSIPSTIGAMPASSGGNGLALIA